MRSPMKTIAKRAVLLFICSSGVGCSGQSSHSGAVAKYIQAVQHGDYKTVIDLTYDYQQHVKAIKAQNPQVLWTKLITEYYESKTVGPVPNAHGLERNRGGLNVDGERPHAERS